MRKRVLDPGRRGPHARYNPEGGSQDYGGRHSVLLAALQTPGFHTTSRGSNAGYRIAYKPVSGAEIIISRAAIGQGAMAQRCVQNDGLGMVARPVFLSRLSDAHPHFGHAACRVPQTWRY